MENKTIKINFKDVVVLDLLGHPISIPNLHEQIGNQLYRTAQTIPVAEAARVLFRGEYVEVNEDSINEIIRLLEHYFIPIVNTSLMKYLNEKLNNLKEQEQEDGDNTSI